MAAPQETLGPYRPRGLNDNPETAPYGSAKLAENVDFSDGEMVPRRGTDIINQTEATATSNTVYRIHLAREFRARKGGAVMVLVSIYGPALTQRYEVSTWPVGDMNNRTDLWTDSTFLPSGGRATCCEYEDVLLLFLPGEGPAGPGKVLTVSGGGDIEEWGPSSSGRPLPGGDEAPYYDSADGGESRLPAGFAAVHNGRMYLAGFPGEDSARIRYTSVTDLYGVATASEIAQAGDTAEPPTGLASFGGKLVIFKRQSIVLADASGQGAEQIQPLTRHTGCVHHNTICQFSHRLGFMSDGGYMVMDQTGNIEELTKAIHPTFMQYRADFANASVIHYPLRHQVWILFPSFSTIFVGDLDSGNWSRYWWNIGTSNGLVKAQCLGTVLLTDGPVPTAGIINSVNHGGYVVKFEAEHHLDYYCAAPSLYLNVRARWLTLPIMSLGHHQPRIFRYLRFVFKDERPDATVRVFWLIEGQAPPIGATGPYLPDQYVEVPLYNPMRGSTFPRLEPVADEVVVVPPEAPGEIPAGVAWEVGDEWFPARVSPGGMHMGRWMQLGIENTSNDDFALRSFEIDTRRRQGRR